MWGCGEERGGLSLGELRQSAGTVCELQRTGFGSRSRNPGSHQGVVVGSHSTPARVLLIRELDHHQQHPPPRSERLNGPTAE